MIVEGAKIGGEIVGIDTVRLYIQTDVKTAETFLDGVKKDRKYRVDMKQYREKRSPDANAYYWVLIGKLAAVLDTSKEEMHNIQLNKYGVIKLDEDGKPEFCMERDSENYLTYKHNHLYPTDKTENRKGVVYRWYIKLKGSSEYDTKEMARLIDGTVEDAKEQGIETLPPDELERMKAAWGEGIT